MIAKQLSRTVLDSCFEGASKPTRSFVFNDRLHLTQSEVALIEMPKENSDSEPEFDRSGLALDVHRALCMPLAWLPRPDQRSLPLRVAVLGAGACALPLFLLEHHSSKELGRLDAVEPSSQVNAIAKRFFRVEAALQHDPRLVIHEEMGEDFFAKQKEGNVLDMVVLDVEAGEGCSGVRAPPLSMLDSSFLHMAKRILVPHGILAVNVITETPEALKSVETKLGQAFSSGLRLSLPANTTFFLFNDSSGDTGTTPLENFVE
ncbi:hypothetical protein PF005_g20060 [Phytophthora fragariae]|uniref:PABS domain-containing protein n=1 Tax=Phytophthora fragariae TaxID=53985 RepID=A0A6A3R0U0_9STRA|nr:hypothetical protein PF009_g20858 [Phytophthora fragariae]KAE8988887.1 hypothetical protein PF011_g18997 [Phytophthora fragariae]KAE9087512.1 hypothetical protein PF007_g20353 [Phytophthora fragariae]KAE9087952.1 hypothetical protein PF010_g19543 [Phytophthora fragariae]KAE9134516.1 hypothetical protein PF006_g14806 [Phytophthora fragariae]